MELFGIKQTIGAMFKYAFVIFVVFFVLQLCGVIAWSWWWIFSPIWILIVVDFIVPSILLLIVEIMETRHGRK